RKEKRQLIYDAHLFVGGAVRSGPMLTLDQVLALPPDEPVVMVAQPRGVEALYQRFTTHLNTLKKAQKSDLKALKAALAALPSSSTDGTEALTLRYRTSSSSESILRA